MNKRMKNIVMMIGIVGCASMLLAGGTKAWCMGLPSEEAALLNGLADSGASWDELEQAASQWEVSHGYQVDGYSAPAATSSAPASSQPEATKQSKSSVNESEAENNVNDTEEGTEAPKTEAEHVHNYRKEITRDATCTEPGEATFTCDEDGDSYTEEIPAYGHDDGSWEVETEPTCTTEGKKVLKCTTCGEMLDEEVIPALGHAPGDWEVTKEADWIHDGEQIRKCTVCEETVETQVIHANHVPLYIIGGSLFLIISIIIAVAARKKRR